MKNYVVNIKYGFDAIYIAFEALFDCRGETFPRRGGPKSIYHKGVGDLARVTLTPEVKPSGGKGTEVYLPQGIW